MDDWEDMPDEKPRKIIKAKRRAPDSMKNPDVPDDLSFEDSQEEQLSEEEVVQRDSDDEEWEDDSDSDAPKSKKQEF